MQSEAGPLKAYQFEKAKPIKIVYNGRILTGNLILQVEEQLKGSKPPEESEPKNKKKTKYHDVW